MTGLLLSVLFLYCISSVSSLPVAGSPQLHCSTVHPDQTCEEVQQLPPYLADCRNYLKDSNLFVSSKEVHEVLVANFS